jgi:hypothetical protein
MCFARLRISQGFPLSLVLFDTVLEFKPEKQGKFLKMIKGMQVRKEEITVYLFVVTWSPAYKTPKNLHFFLKALNLINETSKIAGNKINKQKQIAFL